MRLSFKECDERYQMARVRRSPHERVWQEISETCMPMRGDITLKRTPGSRRIGPVLDNTAPLAAAAFSNFLKAAIIPAQTDWIRLHPSPPFEDDIESRKDLDATGRRLLRAYSDSNFYVQVPLAFRDDAVIGNGVVSVMEKPYRERANGSRFSGFVFEAVPPARVWWEHGRLGQPDLVVASYPMSARAAMRWLGPDAPGSLLTTARMTPLQDVNLIHWVYANDEYVYGGLDSPYYTMWAVYDQQTNQEGRFVKHGQCNYPIYTVFRWMQVDGEEYGRGQGHIARPNARGVNELMRMVLVAAGRDVNAPLMVEDNSVVEFDLSQNGVMVVRPPIKMEPKYLRSGADYEIAYKILDQDRQHIRQSFFMQFLDNPETQPRSAEESENVAERGIQQMAGHAENVHNDLTTLVESSLKMMLEGKALPEFERYLKRIGADNDEACEVVFTSPFFSSQKHSATFRVRRYVAEATARYKEIGDPAWLDNLNPTETNKFLALSSDVPAIILNSDEQANLRRRARARRDAQQRGLQIAQAAMGAGKAAGAGGVGENVPQGSASASATPELEVLP